MTAARGALALAIVLSGIRTAGAEPCVPRAALAGDAAAVAQVAAELRRMGVAIEPATGAEPARCAVVAAIEPDRGGGISVAVRDASQRSEGRVLSNATLAAVWIDSWAQDDFETEAPPPVAAMPVTAPGTVAAIAAPPPAGDRLAVAASYEESWTDDGTSWTGLSGGACARVGAFCLGVSVRYAEQQQPTNLTIAARSDLSALATASWTHPLGRMQIAPEVGLGVGRLTTDRVEGCAAPQPQAQPPCQSTDPTCVPPPPQPCEVAPDGTPTGAVYVGDNFHTTTYTPRGEAALRVSVPLFAHVWLQGLAAVTVAPFGHSAAYQPPPPSTGGTGGPISPAQIALPGDPEAAVQLGIGLRVGAP